MSDETSPIEAPVTLGLIGAGGFGRQHLTAAERIPEVVIGAILSRSLSGYPGAAIYQRLDRFLAHPGLQGVIIVAPNPQHQELVLAALRAGQHVLVEKPLTNGLSEGAILVREATVRKLSLAVGHNSRRAAHVRAMRRLLDDGTLGRIILAEGHFSHDAGQRIEVGNWRWSPMTCPGGPLNLLGIHEIDTLQYLLGPIVHVSGWLRRLATPAEIPDAAVTLFEFASGALAYAGNSYASPWARSLRLFGTRGNARWEDSGELRLDTPDDQHRTIALVEVDTLAEQISDFAASIRHACPSEVDGLTGLRNVAVLEAAIESNRRGVPVAVREMYERAGVLDLHLEAESR